MASFTFTWPHPASEVFVTGTFDDWAKSEKLDRVGETFQKTVILSKVDEKILYKFVVDGNWTHDHMAPSETDSSGNVNNILLAEHLSAADANISSVAPGATTTALAGQVPIREASHDMPGEFPVTPAEETYSVDPIPATAGAGNPISLAPGQAVPPSSSYTTGTVGSNVRLDQESYEKSGSTVPQLPPVLSSQEQKEANGAAIFAVPPTLSSVAPTSTTAGLAGQQPVEFTSAARDPTISSAAPTSTTAQLAGQKPIEPRGVPEVVTESQQAAGVPAEAASSAQAVQDKSIVESELKDNVPTAPSTTESGAAGKTDKGKIAAATGAAVAAGAVAAGAVASTKNAAPAKNVPEVVAESQKQASAAPEAAANAAAVKEKTAVEKELLKKVPTDNQSGAPAPSETAALSSTAPGAGLKPAAEPASGDVSPMSKPVDSNGLEAVPPATPKKAPAATTPTATPPRASDSPADSKKKKRGFMGRLKDKLKG